MSGSCDACGWPAAVGGMLAFGSFGVPIKSKVAQTVDIDPLVMQTYKTSMCFLTSWLVLLYGEELTFTPWGIVSGLFWVPGGIATIFAIKNAGLAIGIGVGSSFIVLVSFTWGIFVFDEHVHNRVGACIAVGCMMVGLLGMAYYSSPSPSARIEQEDSNEHDIGDDALGTAANYQRIQSRPSEDPEECYQDEQTDEAFVGDSVNQEFPDNHVLDETRDTQNESGDRNPQMLCLGRKWSRRTLGILSAMFTGIYGGSILVPMKWAPEDAKGSHYLISFAIGASTVNVCLWIVRYLYLCHKHQSISGAYEALPSFHFGKMWKYGGTCGLLWSAGNFFSILSVEYLGEGVGYSVVQSSILVSGLWGIFYFGEVKGLQTIIKWFLSAMFTVSGILLLSYEHHEK